MAAQKFTVDPRLIEALNQKGQDTAYTEDSDSDAESVVEETRQQKMDRLVREYEEEVAKARAAAEAGEGCLHCSS